ncbi:MAG: hypothetical protein ACK5ZC_09410 [Pirellulaceae bacterium]
MLEESQCPKRLMVVAVEGLRPAMLSCFGGGWSQTPNLDWMAAHGVVFDRMVQESLGAERAYEGLWCGRHAAEGSRRDQASYLWQMLQEQDVPWLLATDRVGWPVFGELGRSGDLLALPSPRDLGEAPERTWWDESLEESLGVWLEDRGAEGVLWLHASGWASTWDAPLAWRDDLSDEEDDQPAPVGRQPPEDSGAMAADPDQVFGWVRAAAAQARALDEAWRMVLLLLEQHPLLADCGVVLLGLDGYPLGEHGVIGYRDCPPFAERYSVPLVFYPPRGLPLGRRSATWTQCTDLYRQTLQWMLPEKSREMVYPADSLPLDLEPSSVVQPRRSSVLIHSEQGRALLAHPWSAVWPRKSGRASSGDDVPGMLFVTPEDSWQCNEVHSRAPGVLEAMSDHRDSLDRWYAGGCRGERPRVVLP